MWPRPKFASAGPSRFADASLSCHAPDHVADIVRHQQRAVGTQCHSYGSPVRRSLVRRQETRYRPWKIDEPMLLPARVQEFVDKDHLARFVLSLVVEEIDLEDIERVYRVDRGQPPFDPAMMTALLLYGYCNGVYSSRRIAKACRECVDFMSIVVLDPPDFRTISEFRKRHLNALSALFGQVLRLCERAGLVKLGPPSDATRAARRCRPGSATKSPIGVRYEDNLVAAQRAAIPGPVLPDRHPLGKSGKRARWQPAEAERSGVASQRIVGRDRLGDRIWILEDTFVDGPTPITIGPAVEAAVKFFCAFGSGSSEGGAAGLTGFLRPSASRFFSASARALRSASAAALASASSSALAARIFSARSRKPHHEDQGRLHPGLQRAGASSLASAFAAASIQAATSASNSSARLPIRS